MMNGTTRMVADKLCRCLDGYTFLRVNCLSLRIQMLEQTRMLSCTTAQCISLHLQYEEP